MKCETQLEKFRERLETKTKSQAVVVVVENSTRTDEGNLWHILTFYPQFLTQQQC